MSSHADETYKSLISIGHEGFKYLALCNGGAAIALLTYLGNTAGKHAVIDLRASMIGFIVGLVFCGLGLFASYLTQLALHNENHLRSLFYKHHHSLWACISLYILSLASFGYGAVLASFRFFAQNHVIA